MRPTAAVMERIFAVLRHAWVYDFFFCNDSTDVLSQLHHAVTRDNTHTMELDITSSTQKTYQIGEHCRLLYTPSFSTQHITVGFAISDIISSSSPVVGNSTYLGRIARDDKKGTMLFISNDFNEHITEVTFLQIKSPSQRITLCGLFLTKPFRKVMERMHTRYDLSALMKSLVYFCASSDARHCPKCQNTRCNCKLKLALKRYPEDDERDLVNLKSYLGGYNGTASLTLYSKGRHIYHDTYSVSSKSRVIDDTQLHHRLVFWALAHATQKKTISPLAFLMSKAPLGDKGISAMDTFLLASIADSVISGQSQTLSEASGATSTATTTSRPRITCSSSTDDEPADVDMDCSNPNNPPKSVQLNPSHNMTVISTHVSSASRETRPLSRDHGPTRSLTSLVDNTHPLAALLCPLNMPPVSPIVAPMLVAQTKGRHPQNAEPQGETASTPIQANRTATSNATERENNKSPDRGPSQGSTSVNNANLGGRGSPVQRHYTTAAEKERCKEKTQSTDKIDSESHGASRGGSAGPQASVVAPVSMVSGESKEKVQACANPNRGSTTSGLPTQKSQADCPSRVVRDTHQSQGSHFPPKQLGESTARLHNSRKRSMLNAELQPHPKRIAISQPQSISRAVPISLPKLVGTDTVPPCSQTRQIRQPSAHPQVHAHPAMSTLIPAQLQTGTTAQVHSTPQALHTLRASLPMTSGPLRPQVSLAAVPMVPRSTMVLPQPSLALPIPIQAQSQGSIQRPNQTMLHPQVALLPQRSHLHPQTLSTVPLQIHNQVSTQRPCPQNMQVSNTSGRRSSSQILTGVQERLQTPPTSLCGSLTRSHLPLMTQKGLQPNYSRPNGIPAGQLQTAAAIPARASSERVSVMSSQSNPGYGKQHSFSRGISQSTNPHSAPTSSEISRIMSTRSDDGTSSSLADRQRSGDMPMECLRPRKLVPVPQACFILPMQPTDAGSTGSQVRNTGGNEIDERRRKTEQRKARNRESAQRSNQKRKMRIQALKNSIAEEAKKEMSLRARQKRLMEENQYLKKNVRTQVK